LRELVAILAHLVFIGSAPSPVHMPAVYTVFNCCEVALPLAVFQISSGSYALYSLQCIEDILTLYDDDLQACEMHLLNANQKILVQKYESTQ